MSKDRFSAEARTAGQAKRRENIATKAQAKGSCQVFVTADTVPGRYRWQIRRFGSLIVAEATEGYLSAELARTAGDAGLGDVRL